MDLPQDTALSHHHLSTFSFTCYSLSLLFALTGCATTGVRSPGTASGLISQEQELGFGRFIDATIQQNYLILDDPALTDKLAKIGLDLVVASDRPDLRYQFRILNDKEVNAFTIPGYIYVHMGALQLMQGKDELAAVLAHEIAHNVQRHVAKNLRNQQTASLLVSFTSLGAMIAAASADPNGRYNVAAQATSLTGVLLAAGVLSKFSRDEEREADDLAVNYMKKAGYDPKGLEMFLARLLEKKKTEKDPSAQRQLTIFDTHPLEEERVQRVRARINQLEGRETP